MPTTHRQILTLAWPIVLANAGVPLLGLVDTAVIGHVGTTADLGAIGLGALIFSFVFWGFGFLRMGTTGFVAQAWGRGDSAEVRATVVRALGLAVVVGTVLIAVQQPIAWLALELIGASDQVERLTRGYYDLRIWAAPASLGMFAVTGALVGLGRTRAVLLVQVVLNGLNAALDVLLAGVLGMGVGGIALGTALAEWTAVAVGMWVLWRIVRAERKDSEPWWPRERLRDWAKARELLAANADIMVRTLFLLLGFGWFVNQGAQFGDRILAANYVLLQLIALSAYLLDGYAHSTEILVGRAIGRARAMSPRGSAATEGAEPSEFDAAVKVSTHLAAISAVVLSLLVLAFGPWMIRALTDLAPVREVAVDYLPWTALYIAVSFAAFQLDGIFIGATATRAMRNASVLSCLGFIALSLPLIGAWENTGLWVAFVGFVVLRAGALGVLYGRVGTG